MAGFEVSTEGQDEAVRVLVQPPPVGGAAQSEEVGILANPTVRRFVRNFARYLIARSRFQNLTVR
jgi:hypothetical protein